MWKGSAPSEGRPGARYTEATGNVALVMGCGRADVVQAQTYTLN